MGPVQGTALVSLWLQWLYGIQKVAFHGASLYLPALMNFLLPLLQCFQSHIENGMDVLLGDESLTITYSEFTTTYCGERLP